jgi:hypothetical protein
MELVWKDLAVANNNFDSSHKPKRQVETSPKRSEFRFKPGRAKRKRVRKDHSDTEPLSKSCRVAEPFIRSNRVLLPAPTVAADKLLFDNSTSSRVGHPQAVSIPELRAGHSFDAPDGETNFIDGTVNPHTFNSSLRLILTVAEVIQETKTNPFWPNTAEMSEIPLGLDTIWPAPDQSNSLPNQAAVNCPLIPYHYSDVLDAHHEVYKSQNTAERVHLLTTGILFQDIAHKYSSILNMCKFIHPYRT